MAIDVKHLRNEIDELRGVCRDDFEAMYTAINEADTAAGEGNEGLFLEKMKEAERHGASYHGRVKAFLAEHCDDG